MGKCNLEMIWGRPRIQEAIQQENFTAAIELRGSDRV
jgi:hypothetical protein